MNWKIRTTHELLGGLNLEYSTAASQGSETGWVALDGMLSIEPGYMTVVTGWPGSGKSEWLDALALNLIKDEDWCFAIYSPENQPMARHMAKWVERILGKPFHDGPTERATWAECIEAAKLLQQNVLFLGAGRDDTPAVDDVLMAFGIAVQQLRERNPEAKCGVIIDPWNELDHMRPRDLTETEYISRTLTRVRNWARDQNVAVFIVAHPAKQRREDGKLPVCRPDMIAGSQHWWNKADVCITVERLFDERDGEVNIHVQKMRFKHLGRIGMATLDYDRVTGRYSDQPSEIYSMHRRA